MGAGTMSFSEGYGDPRKDFREQLIDYDEGSMIFGSTSGPSSSSRKRNSMNDSANLPTYAKDRLSAPLYSSEISMDLSDLQDALGEEDTTGRYVSGSINSQNASENHSISLWQQRQNSQNDPINNHLWSVEEDTNSRSDDDDGGRRYSYQSGTSSVNDSTIQFGEIPEDFFQSNDLMSSPISQTEHQQKDQHQSLSTVDEQGDCSISIPSLGASNESSSRNSFHSSTGNAKSQRRVKFEKSTRLEDIREFEKPDFDDYHKLYYTSHELQKMIDGRREEEQRERHGIR